VLWGLGLPDPASHSEPHQSLKKQILKGEQPKDVESDWSNILVLKSNISL